MKPRSLLALLCTATLFPACARAQAAAASSLPLPPPADTDMASAPLVPPLPPPAPPPASTSGPFEPALAPPGPAHPLPLSRAPGRGSGGRRLYRALLTRFDARHLGYLTPDEQTRAMAFLEARRPRVYRMVLRRFPSPAAFFRYLSQLPPAQ